MRKLDYSKKYFKNPATRRSKRKVKKSFYITFVLFLFIIFINYILFYSPLFKIKAVEINGEDIDKDNIASFFINKNIILLDTKSIKNKLYGLMPLDLLTINRKFPNTVAVDIKKIDPDIIWVTQNKGYLVNSRGNIYSSINGNDVEKYNIQNYNILRHKYVYNDIPIIYDKNNLPIPSNNKILEYDNITFIKKIFENIDQVIDTNIIYYEISLDNYTLKITAADSLKILFSLQDNPDDQLHRLSLVYQNKDTVGKILDYIDLRYGDKVFYK